ncbi:MAG: DUF3048 domain-containing protein [Firmicutes bacterium]|nr:DUF3048 domain-containing protein [Bacillota bacterium]
MSFQGPNDENPRIPVEKEEKSLLGIEDAPAPEVDRETSLVDRSGISYSRTNPYQSRVEARKAKRRLRYPVVFVGVVILGLLLGAGTYWATHRQKAVEPETAAVAPVPAASEAPAVASGTPCPLCGLPVEKVPEHRPIAVMIDNLNLARPHSGLDQADLVYEAPVEGGITRLMAVFYHQRPGKIGPIRSARPYFIGLSQENQAVYIHCGGSTQAMETLANRSIASVDEFGNSKYFWRSTQRSDPHNLYSSIDQLEQAAQGKGLSLSRTPSGRQFLTDAASPAGGGAVESITLNYGSSPYEARYVYNATDKLYQRYTGGQPHLDADSGKQLTAANVVIQYVSGRVLDTEGRLELGVIGSGKAAVYMRGQKIEGTWSKSGSTARTVFKDQQGTEIAFAPGTTWIQLATPNVRVY